MCILLLLIRSKNGLVSGLVSPLWLWAGYFRDSKDGAGHCFRGGDEGVGEGLRGHEAGVVQEGLARERGDEVEVGRVGVELEVDGEGGEIGVGVVAGEAQADGVGKASQGGDGTVREGEGVHGGGCQAREKVGARLGGRRRMHDARRRLNQDEQHAFARLALLNGARHAVRRPHRRGGGSLVGRRDVEAVVWEQEGRLEAWAGWGPEELRILSQGLWWALLVWQQLTVSKSTCKIYTWDSWTDCMSGKVSRCVNLRQ